jgi:hypothetical protein
MAQEAAFANRMLAKADQYLAAVDDAFILTATNHSARAMPTFRPQEVSLGRELGHGGFGVVFAISKFTLDEEEEEEGKTDKADVEGAETPPASTGAPSSAGQPDVSVTRSGNFSEMDDTEHYAIDKARHVMEHRVLRRGQPRYALKMLHADLSQVERARGMIDLALEAKYLSIVWHPNISTLMLLCGFYRTDAVTLCSSHRTSFLPLLPPRSQNERHGKRENGGPLFLYCSRSLTGDIDQTYESMAQATSQIQFDFPGSV